MRKFIKRNCFWLAVIFFLGVCLSPAWHQPPTPRAEKIDAPVTAVPLLTTSTLSNWSMMEPSRKRNWEIKSYYGFVARGAHSTVSTPTGYHAAFVAEASLELDGKPLPGIYTILVDDGIGTETFRARIERIRP